MLDNSVKIAHNSFIQRDLTHFSKLSASSGKGRVIEPHSVGVDRKRPVPSKLATFGTGQIKLKGVRRLLMLILAKELRITNMSFFQAPF